MIVVANNLVDTLVGSVGQLLGEALRDRVDPVRHVDVQLSRVHVFSQPDPCQRRHVGDVAPVVDVPCGVDPDGGRVVAIQAHVDRGPLFR